MNTCMYNDRNRETLSDTIVPTQSAADIVIEK
jgi:hypothetical protein